MKLLWAVLVLCGVSAVTGLAQTPLGHLAGSVHYRAKVALPPGCTLVVSLETASGTPIAEARFAVGSNQSPLPFRLAFYRSVAREAQTYKIHARIMEEQKVLFATQQPVMTDLKGSTMDLRIEVSPFAPPTSELLNTYWKLESIRGKPIHAKNARREPYFLLTLNSYKMRGSGGVNDFSGTYNLKGGTLTITPGATTLMAGSQELMNLEREFLTVLTSASSYTIQGDRLTLWKDRERLATFVAVYF